MKLIDIKKYVLFTVFWGISQIGFAQTQPTAQSIAGGFTQNFDAMGTTYPAGFTGWKVENAAPGGATNPRTKEPISDAPALANGTAATTAQGVFNFSGKLGLQSGNSSDYSIALAINTTAASATDQVQVNFDAMVIRNRYDGGTYTVLNSLMLQYRIGTSGVFTNLANTVRNNITVTQTSGTNGVGTQNFTFLLPKECSNQSLVQLRWILRAISGTAAASADRPSFAIDNLSIGVAPTPPAFTGYVISTKNITTVSSGTFATNTLSGVTRIETLGNYLGSIADYKGTTKAYFTTYKDPFTGVWNLLDPDGNLFYSIGVNDVEKGGSIDPVTQLKSIYANTIGNFSDETINTMPYTSRLNFALNYRGTSTRTTSLYDNNILPVFDVDFAAYCNNKAALIPANYVTDKNLIGYFSDNEVPLSNPASGNKLIVRWLDVNNYGGQSTADTDPNYQAAVNWMKNRHGGALTTPNQADIDEWPGVVAAKYYSVCRDAIRSVDTNHLYLGSRLHQDLKNPYLFQAAGTYCDVVSVNNYNVWTDADIKSRLDVWGPNAQKPFLIGEFYTQAQDSGLPNASGAGYVVYTQQDRADFFENYAMAVLKNKYSVGFHYFKYLDDPASLSDATIGNNKGLLNDNYAWWQPLQKSFTKIGQDIYRLRDYLISTQTLPVTLVDFDAKKEGNRVKLIWKTQSEQNNERFEIQHSNDAINYKTIKITKGNGTTNQSKEYVEYHLTPSKGDNYYKLVQYDLDGKATEKGVRSVNFSIGINSTLSIYPNPSNGLLNINLGDQKDGETTILITDMIGRVIHQEKLFTIGGLPIKLNLKDKLTVGQYILRISKNGESQVAKIQTF